MSGTNEKPGKLDKTGKFGLEITGNLRKLSRNLRKRPRRLSVPVFRKVSFGHLFKKKTGKRCSKPLLSLTGFMADLGFDRNGQQVTDSWCQDASCPRLRPFTSFYTFSLGIYRGFHQTGKLVKLDKTDKTRIYP